MSRIDKFMETESRPVRARGAEVWGWALTANRCEVYFEVMKSSEIREW